MIYLLDKRANRYNILNDEDYTIIDSVEMEKILKEHEFDLNNNFGEIIFEGNKPVFKDFTTKMYVGKDTLQFSMASYEAEENEYFDVVEVTYRDFFNNDQKRQKLSGEAMVLYWDGEFHEVYYKENYYFDIKDKIYKLDEERIKYDLEYKLSIDRLEDIVRHRGFELSIGGNIYLQPFRTGEDRSYLEALERYIEPANRELKLFKNMNNERDSLYFDILRGEVVSDELIKMIIGKILIAESNIKPIIKKVREEILAIKNLEEKLAAADKVKEKIYEELKKIIN